MTGLAAGIVADGKVNQKEAEYLHGWLRYNSGLVKNPLLKPLYEQVEEMLSDNVLDADEAEDLLQTLKTLADYGNLTTGEMPTATTLPLDDPTPKIAFQGQAFLFTGTFAYGKRDLCHQAVKELGGECLKGVTKSLDFLVIGSYVTDSWKHTTYGRKIEKAVDYRSRGCPLNIISEAHWAAALG